MAATAAKIQTGGFNIGQLVPEHRRTFAPEYLWNLEAGLRFAAPVAALEGELATRHLLARMPEYQIVERDIERLKSEFVAGIVGLPALAG